ncbi:coiled-coil domain-containing protein 136-like isoform X2 [Corythoichthys intestinalis]|uniref:coiled-coil domain-containing protein 136-like isoform X2 n=1 Tax=Corythoichthys intestinalis TaxID=161448 RepID=UPI0025A53C62|nr:coiled-coil domain-containing protein 136-like isoform X2 [Corythoichthys intestinalis]
MNGLRLPPLIEEVLDSYGQLKDDVCQRTQDGKLAEEEEEDEEAGVEELRLRMVELLMELEETRQDSCRQEENFHAMKSMLEDERMAKAHQAETFTRQLDALKGTVHHFINISSPHAGLEGRSGLPCSRSPLPVELARVRGELAAAEREKRSDLEEAEMALRRAEETALALQEAGEEAAAESENDIACLQEELCRLGAGIQRLRDRDGQRRVEIGALRMDSGDARDPAGESARAEDEFASLSRQRLQLSDANRQLSSKVRQEEQKQPATEVESCSPPAAFQGVAQLQVQLQKVEDSELKARAECERIKRSLSSLRRLHDDSRRECTTLEEELRHCKGELQRILGEGAQGDAGGCNLAAAAVAVAAIFVLLLPSLTRV